MKLSATALAALAAATVFVGPASAAPARRQAVCCRVVAGTLVKVELVDPISTKTQKAGDHFAIRLSEPLTAQGRIVAPTGATGVGEVIDASKPGMGGKAAKIVLAAKYLQQGRTRIFLRGLQIASAGRGYANTANAVGLGGIAFGPLGFAAMAIRGGDVDLPAGTSGMAKVSAAVTLPSLGRAPSGVADSGPGREPEQGTIPIAPPPRDQGQVVFFRGKSMMGTGQWFNVREDGAALGKLTNGAYFIHPTTPGLHTYTASTEPEFKDRLKLQIDPGETYFVEGALTKGLVIGAANLSPSEKSAFDKASKDLKPAPPPEPEKPKVEAAR
jgi:hypothetical protein